MDTLSNMLEEASNIANFEVDPLMENGGRNDMFRMRENAVNKAPKLKEWKNKEEDKPKRPLSAYNLFFQHEREKIITCNPNASFKDTMHKIRNTPRPKKRRHRKSHGKIGFAELARTIADKWKKLDPEEKNIFESEAEEEKAKYKVELDAWTKAREEKAKMEEQKTPMERARVEVVYDEDDSRASSMLSSFKHSGMPFGSSMSKNFNTQDSLSALMLQHQTGNRSMQNHQNNDVRDYLQVTQQTIDMARATLSLPLFANLGNQTSNNSFGHSGMSNTMGGMSRDFPQMTPSMGLTPDYGAMLGQQSTLNHSIGGMNSVYGLGDAGGASDIYNHAMLNGHHLVENHGL